MFQSTTLCTRVSGDDKGEQNLDPDFKGADNILLSNVWNGVLPRKRPTERIEKKVSSVLVVSDLAECPVIKIPSLAANG